MQILIVLLAILKYMLLFLLFLLIFIIVLIIILLACPIRYKVLINYKETDLFLKINVTYLGKIVNFALKKNPNSPILILLRVFNKKFNLSGNVDKKSSHTKSNKKNQNTTIKPKATPNNVKNQQSLEKNNTLEETINNEAHSQSNSPNLKKEKDLHYENLDKSKDNTEEDNTKEDNTEEDNTKNKESKPKNKKDYISLAERLYDIYEIATYYMDSYDEYKHRGKIIEKFKLILKNIFDSLIPKNFDFSGKIFILDPALTGQILGLLYILHGTNSKFNVSVDADFENEKNDFTSLISGRILLLKMIYPFIVLAWYVLKLGLYALKVEAKHRKISRIKLIKILIKNFLKSDVSDLEENSEENSK